MLKSIINKNSMNDDVNFNEIKFMIGKSLCFSQKGIKASKLSDVEFQVFSQWGEDGIIEYILSNIPIRNKFFIEFGVEDYIEANTRFLMMNRNWSGLVIDGSQKNIELLKKQKIYWQYDLQGINQFITKENINEIIRAHLSKLNIDDDIGILSVDIDGNDYWVLNEINVINPSIIICEYNSIFGNKHSLTVPYDKNFNRTKYHYSNLYWGASIKAFDSMLSKRGYVYVGSNKQNLNAFFIKRIIAEKYIPDLITSIDNDFMMSAYRESRDENNNLTYKRGKERLNVINDMEVLNLDSGGMVKLKEIL
jgi:hypothetical protein